MDNEETKKKFDTAVSLYKEERYDEALPLFVALAEQEHAGACYYLTSCHRSGYREWSGKTNITKRLEWLRKAAEHGIADAQYDLGGVYMIGKTMEADYKKAAEWFHKAAEQGNKKAYGDLGFCYEKGAGVSQDFAKAAEWYQKAADQGDTFAKECLDKVKQKQKSTSGA
jgi:TPR repeat protein